MLSSPCKQNGVSICDPVAKCEFGSLFKDKVRNVDYRMQFIEELGESPALNGSLPEIIRSWDALLGKIVQKYEIPPPDDSVKTEDVKLEHIWLRKYTPPKTASNNPVGIYIHGGGWAMGSVDQEDAVCRIISKQCEMSLVSISYRLAPKFKYPIPLEDCVEGAKWTIGHFEAKDITIIGASAGAGLAIGVALKLIDEGLSNSVRGLIAVSPVTIHPDAVPEDLRWQYTSTEEHSEHTVNTKSAMQTFRETYGAPPTDPYTSNLLHPRLNELKKVYLVEAEVDTLRDDARLLKGVLEKENVLLKYDSYPGYPHYSWSFPSKRLEEHRNDFFQNLFKAIIWINN